MGTKQASIHTLFCDGYANAISANQSNQKLPSLDGSCDVQG